jgi:hypothetical protein
MAEENTNNTSTLDRMLALSPIPYFGETRMYKWKFNKNMQDTTRYPGNEAKTEAVIGTFFSRTFIYIAYLSLFSL